MIATPAIRPRASARNRRDASGGEPPLRPWPAWLRDCAAGEGASVFAAGCAVAGLDPAARAEAPWSGVWRSRLALACAAAAARSLRVPADDAVLRDAVALAAPGGDPGPAGRLFGLWLSVAGGRSSLDLNGLAALATAVGGPAPAGNPDTASSDHPRLERRSSPLEVAAATAVEVWRRCGERIEAEVVAWAAADIALASRLGWRPVPLLAAGITSPSVRRGGERRPRPGDRDWLEACAAGYAVATMRAQEEAVDLSRRASALVAAAPRLRAKGAERVVSLLLSVDAVAPATARRASGLSDRAARRLFDRLRALGVVREISGRTQSRLYGL